MVKVKRVNVLAMRTRLLSDMNLLDYNYEIGTHTYLIETASLIVIEFYVNHNIIGLPYIRYMFVKMPFLIISYI